MEELLAWLFFFLRLIVFALIIGIPLILAIVLITNFLYKRLNLDKRLRSKD